MAELLGQRIRKARERYGMSQAELARRIGVSKNTMNLIESSKTPDPGVLKVQAIAAVLRISLDDLIGGKAKESESQPTELATAGNLA